MVYVPHYRLTMSGVIGPDPGNEIWSCTLNISNGDTESLEARLLGAQPDDAVYDQFANSCALWFIRPASGIHPDCGLRKIKIAHVGADGKYTGAPVERPSAQQGHGANGIRHPNSVALALTLNTTADLGRVKGRIYSPLPAFQVLSDGTISAVDRNAASASFQQLVNDINNQPGLDVLDLRVVVASQGRHNKNGTVRLGPGNHVVTSVGVGRVLDTVRRRRNALVEGRDTLAVA